jgi:hypothetical protein
MNTKHDVAAPNSTATCWCALLGALVLPFSLLPAQSPCAPPTHLATQERFQSTHYYNRPGQDNAAIPPVVQNLPAGYRGFLCLFDLTASANVMVSQVDFAVADDGHWAFHWGPAPGVIGGPGLVGQTAVVNVYTTPTSWVGRSTTPAAWTLLSTGTLTVAGYDQHSPAVFSTPFLLPAGTYGVAFEVGPVTAVVPHITYQNPPYALNPLLLVGSFVPGTPLTARDQFLSFANEDIINQAFVLPPGPQPKNPIFDIHYSVVPNSAYSASIGSGCYDRPRAFYEVFPTAPAPFDLSNTAFHMTPSGGGYVVSSVNRPVVAPVSQGLMNASNQPMGDNDRTAVLPLGFTFPYAGGSTTSLAICSDGIAMLDTAAMGNQKWLAGIPGFLQGQPLLSPFGTDLDPRVGGSIHLDVDPVAQTAYLTWLNVPAWGMPGTANTFQVALYGSGDIEYRYGTCAATNETTLVGFTPGWSAHDPGSMDLTAAMPFATGDGALPPALSMSARPMLGTTPGLVTRDMPQGSVGGVFLGGPSVPVELGFLGMPGCLQQVAPIDFQFFLASGTTGTVSLGIPSATTFLGMRLIGQSVVVSPGSNAGGGIVSNPICINLGL